ncbi:hypothetical protein B0T26DRAFT_116033 [Lasiosphaeria miniovina]|uniref:Uncharacterized protein n=1 Tax=Lasiosphaeria miniovina TaxID=1954250 RepID=A0AA40B3R1_9PEZI|nr:uncharacterized protein B0T26DRAFT_116033 [Lasiosphaeria miniovina]KAK0727081.1 hypothetical protein B0T26DRAFT_116033 [Lasiosphaeria miniovina]
MARSAGRGPGLLVNKEKSRSIVYVVWCVVWCKCVNVLEMRGVRVRAHALGCLPACVRACQWLHAAIRCRHGREQKSNNGTYSEPKPRLCPQACSKGWKAEAVYSRGHSQLASHTKKRATSDERRTTDDERRTTSWDRKKTPHHQLSASPRQSSQFQRDGRGTGKYSERGPQHIALHVRGVKYVSHNDVGLWTIDVMLPPPLTWAPGR